MAGHEFVLSGPDAVAAAWAALAPGYTAVARASRRQTRIWLDTFDSRLRAAGLTLAHLGGAELLLTGPDGVTLRQRAALGWPALIEAVPPGPVAERLRPVVTIRALLPVAQADIDVSEWRLLDRDGKTVVRAYLERASAGGTVLPCRLRLVPARGCDDRAARIARLLAKVPGVRSAVDTELDLLREAGATIPAGSPPAGTSLRPGQPVTAGLAALLLGWWDAIEGNVPGVVGDVDTEFLHDLRVAVRRTRSVLKLAGDVLPAGVAERFAPEFKWLGDASTPLRDLDVLLLDFPEMLAALTEARPDDLAPLLALLRARRAAERRRMLRALRSSRFTDLAGEWRAALAPTGGRRRGVDARALAAQRIARAWGRVERRTRTLTGDPPPEVLHDIRKRCKELRYLLELFADLCQPQPHRALVKELKAVQDSLGLFQDAEVHRDAMRGYAEALLSGKRPAGSGGAGSIARTVLAMGELVACYGARQRRAGAEAVVRVTDLVSDANRQRVVGLVSPG